ncbi:MAG: serine/threonine protein kinase [Kofleriaceae bacterium]|nr:serine/threonine protein kinase [Kofleriaceae bacterium]
MTAEAPHDARSWCPTCHAVFRGSFARCPRDGAVLDTGDDDPLVGTILAERYQIESLIGEGGVGRVYKARHLRMSRQYAIKVPFGELGYDAKVRARFANEAEATSRLRHPNVVGVVDVGETPQGLLYMAMDLAEGASLADLIERDGPMDAARVLHLIRQVARGLEHAHERGLVHRDLKPENVIVEPDADGTELARIVDFGIALFREEHGTSRGKLTTEGIVLGTPYYMAPEQAVDGEIDHRVDIFALGLMTYELLAGTLPFTGSPIDVARQNLGAQPPRIAERVPGLAVDPLLEALAFRMLEKRPADRPQHLREVIGLLDAIERDPTRARAFLVAAGSPIAAEAASPDGDGDATDDAVGGAERRLDADAATAPPPTRPDADARDVTRTSSTGEGDALEPALGAGRRRRRVIAIAIALLVLLLLGALVLNDHDDRDATAATRADARPAADATAVLPEADAAVPDAGVVDVVDAAVPIDAPRRPTLDARGPRRPDAGVRRPVDAGLPRQPRQTVDAAPAAPPSKASLTALYERVGTALEALRQAKGAEVAKPLEKRYLAVPYLDAVRHPEIRDEVMGQLRAIEGAIARAR